MDKGRDLIRERFSRCMFGEALRRFPLIMGVINVTPDSFSDGGETFSCKAAVARGEEMMKAGADILDIGGESTRPGATPISVEEELARVIPVIRALQKSGACLSVDTRHRRVMEAVVDLGVSIINDVSALEEEGALEVVSRSEACVVLMHMQGKPATMQDAPGYDRVSEDVRGYLADRIAACKEQGIAAERIIIDPGIGFGKTVLHNLELLNTFGDFLRLGCLLMIGVSRKSFIGRISGETNPRARVPGGIAAALAAVARGVDILRVHDIQETRQALDVWRAIEKPAEFSLTEQL